jgi:transglutaminase-like putative cysteine protease
MGMTITRQGDLAGMNMNMGIFTIDIVPAAGPVKLAGAELDAVSLVTAAGPAPATRAANRYRLPPAAQVAADEFQSQDGAVVTVRSRAEPSPLADAQPFLRAEAQLELDDAALRAWVENLAQGHREDAERLAEHLRLAVRSHITTKDLSQGDASALETFRSKRGDCTEHANLLCAALRIAGIPARVEVGIVFSAVHGGWVGHAWNSAHVAGRWMHLDSAYPGIARSCYLKLGSTSGGNWASTGAALLANLSKILGKTVETLP